MNELIVIRLIDLIDVMRSRLTRTPILFHPFMAVQLLNRLALIHEHNYST